MITTAQLADVIHAEILDVAPAHTRALVDLLHGRFRAPITPGCLAACLGMSRDVAAPLLAIYGPALEIGHILKLRAAGYLACVDQLSPAGVAEIETLLEAHRIIPARPPASFPTANPPERNARNGRHRTLFRGAENRAKGAERQH